MHEQKSPAYLISHSWSFCILIRFRFQSLQNYTRQTSKLTTLLHLLSIQFCYFFSNPVINSMIKMQFGWRFDLRMLEIPLTA